MGKKIKGLVRASHLFAKTKEQKRKVGKKLYHVSMEIHRELQNVFDSGVSLSGSSKQELARITNIMKTLFPQIKHFLETGFVAPKKIIHLKMSELYAIVRGKAGKSVEFGLKWGVSRIGGGFVQGFLINGGDHCSDKRFCMEALRVHQDTLSMAEKIKRERAQVEGCIGTIKSPIYGFNKPNARSVQAMGTYGQRAIAGFNMRKMARELTKLQAETT